MFPEVTVIITTYNRSQLLPNAIESVLEQTFKGFELLVVDNGSTDNTRSIVEQYKDDRVKYILNDEPTGSCAAPRNLGIKIAKSKYIAFLDDDDIWYPKKLEICTDEFEKNPEVVLVCHAQNIVQDGKIIRVKINGPWSEDVYERLLYDGNFLSPGASLIKKEAFAQYGSFSTKNRYLGCDDYEFWIRLAKARAKFYFINDVLAEFRITGFNSSLVDPYFSLRITEMINEHLANYEASHSLSPRARERMSLLYGYVASSFFRYGNKINALKYFIKIIKYSYPNFRVILQKMILKVKNYMYSN